MLLLLALIALAVVLWQRTQEWAPSRAEYPTQGALLGEQDGAVDFNALRATGADFVYLEASHGAEGRDAQFPRNLAAAIDTQLPHGVVTAYGGCCGGTNCCCCCCCCCVPAALAGWAAARP